MVTIEKRRISFISGKLIVVLRNTNFILFAVNTKVRSIVEISKDELNLEYFLVYSNHPIS